MIEAGMPPTWAGGYYRTHDLRKSWTRWINENGGSIEEIAAVLHHSSPDVTYKYYFADTHKRRLAESGHAKGLVRLKSLLDERDELDGLIMEHEETFRDLECFEVFDDGGFAMPEGTAYGGPGSIEEVRAPGLEPGTS